MKKRLFILATSFTITPILIFICIIYFSYLSYIKSQTNLSQDNSKVAYAALPINQNLLRDKIVSKDARTEILEAFFKKYKSELFPFAQDIVQSADEFGIDYKLVPAIAMQESNLCKKSPAEWHNCWGFGIYKNKTTTFNNYEEAIAAVSKTLGKYKNSGLVTPDQIMTKYTPHSNGSWARGVSHFMAELENTNL